MDERRPQSGTPGQAGYFPDERGDVPAAIEDASEEAWRDYDRCCEALEREVARLRASAATQARDAIRQAAAGRGADAALGREWSQPQAATTEPPVPAAASRPVPFVRRLPPPTVDSVLAFVRSRSRVCPKPTAWRRLFLLLPPAGAKTSKRPPAPPDDVEWASLPDFSRQALLRELVDWAAAEGALDLLDRALKGLGEEDWHHLPALSWPELAP